MLKTIYYLLSYLNTYLRISVTSVLSAILLTTGLIFFSTDAYCQFGEDGELSVSFSLPPVALIDIEPDIDNNIVFSVIAPSESGTEPQIQEISGESLWINYSSALSNPQTSRSIVAEISTGALPDGVVLNVEASEYDGAGDGQFGVSAGKISLNNQPQAIINNVGNCFTGDGTANGHMLTFSIEVADFSQIYSGEEYTCTILYTISDN